MTHYLPEPGFTGAELVDQFGADPAGKTTADALELLLVGMVEANKLGGDDLTKWLALSRLTSAMAILADQEGVDLSVVVTDTEVAVTTAEAL